MSVSYRTPVVRIQVVRDGAAIPIRPKVTSDYIACRVAAAFFREYQDERERMVVVPLDIKHRPIHYHISSVGTLDSSLVHAREVFRLAIHRGAAAILIAHNHPSGDPTPSAPDRKVTEKIDEVGKIIGIQMLDHIVYGDETGDCYSFTAKCIYTPTEYNS